MCMDMCDNTLSWDGVLCNRCRQLFDGYLVRNAHEQGSCHQEAFKENSASSTALYQGKGRADLWWHNISSLKRCAEGSCKLCELTLSRIDLRDREKLESWQATLPVTCFGEETRPQALWVYTPKADPRPEAEIFDPFDPNLRRVYGLISVQVNIQDVSGPLNHESLRTHEISSLSTDSDATFGQIRTWLRSCKSHQACIVGSAFPRRTVEIMPTRLLELAPGNGGPNVRLVHTAQIKSTNISYATLSHCWGSTLTAKLLKSLIQDYSSNIPWQSLSQTFKDAISTTVKLDIHYLWIDALCIIQDDNDDWTYEAARMAGVYSNSYLNISADASKDGTEGLFRRRNPTTLRSFLVPHQKGDGNRCGSVFYTDRWWSSVYNSPLADRAWTIQERFLAPRGLHFAQEEVHWECMELFTAEGLPILLNTVPDTGYVVQKSSFRRYAPAQQAIYSVWYQLVAAYSSGALTFTSDRPIAIAGLAWVFCHLLELSESDYLCGMWRPQLGHDLMWREHGDWPSHPQDLRVANLPTWSWLSLCKRIWIYPKFWVGDRNVDNLITAEVVQAFTMHGHDAFGSVSSGDVTLRVPLCQVTIRKGNRPFYEAREDYNHVIDVSGSILREVEHFEYHPDDNTDVGTRQILNTPVYLMLGRALKSEGTSCSSDKAAHSPKVEEICTKASLLGGQKYECLILKESGQFGHFRRLGYVRFEPAIYTWSDVSDDQADQLRRYARNILYKHFVDGMIPDSVCGRPDHGRLYTITLV